ncbi:MAG TPA: NAD-dependent epimerase/dehydratase family protein [Ramlibacter sp.]|uniref:NAD-dependent epimerase/dehydratase family protein n=1 Tax=Ramlibacter sp. TaxID=1917967 RepID=UPI002C87BFB3|nr:NAD-dependent epimerase/dehydratase family protein [Ramlibacter sp.]HVZ42868.1 NAD-dependent epimerase/dehydratase family protein [Ramlibacter sp.]
MKIEGNKFLITGGASQVGSHICEQLLAQGAREVVLYDNFALAAPDAAAELTRNERVRLVRGDILRLDQLMAAMDGVQGVFAVAAFLTLPLSRDLGYGMDVNVRGHANVLDACRFRGVKKVVSSSSVAVYGAVGSGPITEEQPLDIRGVQPPSIVYATSKLMNEGVSRYYAQHHGIDFVSLRYSTIYGPRQHLRGLNALYIIDTYRCIARDERPRLPGDGSEVHDYIFVEDVARANVRSMESDVTGEAFNISTGVATSLNRIVEILLDITGKKLEPEYVQDPKLVRFLATSELHYSPEKAKKLLGWQAEVPIEAGIRRMVDWVKTQPSF